MTGLESTTELLNLNSPYLVNKRRDWLDELNRCIADPENELGYLACVYLIPYGEEEKLDPFFSASRQHFEAFADHLLKNKAPQLLQG